MDENIEKEPSYAVADHYKIYSIIQNKVVISDVVSLETIKELTHNDSLKLMYVSLSPDKLIVLAETDQNNTEVFVYNKKDFFTCDLWRCSDSNLALRLLLHHCLLQTHR